MWLWAQTAGENSKQNVQIHDADGVQAFLCVIYDTVGGLYLNSNTTSSRGVVSEPPAPYVPAEAPVTRHATL